MGAKWKSAVGAAIVSVALMQSSCAYADEAHRDVQPVIGEMSAGFLGFGEEATSDNPFTLYGSVFKKYLIEVLDGEDIVARKRGFTAETCIAAVPLSEEGPGSVGLPVMEKVRRSENTICQRAVGPELKPACAESCELACERSMSTYIATAIKTTGIAPDEANQQRMMKNCKRQCTYECTKPGKASSFDIPSRR